VSSNKTYTKNLGSGPYLWCTHITSSILYLCCTYEVFRTVNVAINR